MDLKIYSRQIFKRAIIVALLLVIAFFSHKFFSSLEKDILGAVLFISFFSAGLLFYYASLFRGKQIHKNEFIFSIIFVFFLTIIMFAFIYAEPIDDTNNYFVENTTPKNLTFSDAIYFSATTISTLGSNIYPQGVFRLFVIIEVYFGMIYTGTILYFITRELEKSRKKNSTQ